MKKQTLSLRFLSIALLCVLLFTGLPVQAVDSAVTSPAAPLTECTTPVAEEWAAPITDEALTEPILGPGELTLAELATAKLAEADIPAVLSTTQIAKKAHVNRLYDQEKGLSHIVFQNRDGSKTAYFYGQPVKYVAADGSLQDKSKTLVALDKTYLGLTYTYGIEKNSIRQYYAQDPSIGMLITLGAHTIRVRPQGIPSLASHVAQMSDNRIAYPNLFGQGSLLVYTPLLDGVKEDIILSSYTGVSDFSFTYEVVGLSLIEREGTYTFIDDAGTEIATLGEILITDAAGKSTIGSLTADETEKGVYTVTVHADRKFLTDPATTYPVTVDPTIHEKEINHDSGNDEYAILDYAVYSGTIPSDSSAYHHLGYAGSNSVGRIIYKFPMFIKHSALTAYAHLNQYQIASAYLLLSGAPASNYPSTWVTAYPLTQHFTNTTNAFQNQSLFNSCKNGSPTSRSVIFFDDTYSEINLTPIFKAWAAFNAGDNSQPDPAKGVVLVDEQESNPGYQKRIYTVEDPGADMVLIVDFAENYIGGIHYIANIGAGGMLQRTSDTSSAMIAPYDTARFAKWRVEYIGHGGFVLRSPFNNTQYLAASGDSVELISTTSETIPHTARWTISGPAPGYLIKNTFTGKVLYSSNGSTLSLVTERAKTASDYTKTKWLITNPDNMIFPTSVSYTGQTFLTPGISTSFSFTKNPSNATYCGAQYFVWTSSNSSFTFNNICTLTIPSSGGIATLTAKHIFTGLSVSFTVKSGAIQDGRYKLRNEHNKTYMDIKGPSPNANTKLNNYGFHGGRQQEWKITLLASGEYEIQSDEYSGLYVDVSAVNSGADIIQNVASQKTTWKIKKTASGHYCIYVTSGATDYAISTRAGLIVLTDALVLNPYAQDSDYHDEWSFINYDHVNYVEWEAQENSNWCWLASARMFAKYYSPDVQLSQSDMAGLFRTETNWNSTGSIDEIEQAISLYLNNTSSSVSTYVPGAGHIYSKWYLERFIDDGHVILIGRLFGGGHATLITGYVYIDGVHMFVVQDPWPSSGTMLCSYEFLVNGNNATSMDNADSYIWRDTCVANTYYAQNTILNPTI